jgi:ferric-dicitrate binding protein FerR (iron transport regulator)
MNERWTAEQLLDAIGDLCNGTIDEGVGRELDDLLAGDAQARRIYTNYMWTHACLYAEAGSLHHEGDATRHAALTSHLDTLDDDLATPRRGARRSWLALAAAILGVAAFSSWATARWTERQMAEQLPTATEQLAVPAADAVARITGTHNCIWSNPQETISYGSALFPGQRIELAEGLAEITFDDGATLLLEGPASFNVDSSNKVALLAGRLAAVVPQRAAGFHVRTTSLDVFDVGTEFGLVAQESGAAEVHVFNGLVKADVLDHQGRATRRLELNAAEAARISPLSTTVVEFPANDASFVRNISPAAGPHDGLLADESFRYPEGPLEAQNGGFGWAGPWFTTSADDEDAGPDSNRVAPGSLAVQGIVPVGNRAILTGHRNRIRRQLATSVGGVFDAEGLVENQDEVRLVGRDGKNVYLSFVQRVSRVDDGFYGLELHRGDGNGNRVLCIGNGADGAGYGATSNVNVYGAKNLPSLGAESTEPNFFVIKIAFGVGNRDTLEIFRNPASLRDEKECQPDAVLRGNFAFDRISLANFDGSKVHEVDELRVGTHFLAVTGRWGNNQGRLRQPIASLDGAGPRARTADLKTGWLDRCWLVASGGQ